MQAYTGITPWWLAALELLMSFLAMLPILLSICNTSRPPVKVPPQVLSQYFKPRSHPLGERFSTRKYSSGFMSGLVNLTAAVAESSAGPKVTLRQPAGIVGCAQPRYSRDHASRLTGTVPIVATEPG